MKKRTLKILKIMSRTFLLLTALVALTTCKFFTPGLGDSVDIDLPLVGLESHNNGDYIGGLVSLSGFASDEAGINSVTISHGSDSFNASYSNGQWDLNLDTTPYPDGNTEITITAIDSAKKEASVEILLVIDNSPPSVLVNVPTDYGTDQQFNKYISIKGEAADTTRVDKVFISLFDTNDTLADTSDDTAIFTDEKATGTSSWYYIFNAENYGGLLGDYYFFVKAVDPSGNSNSYFYHFEDVLDIAVVPGETPNIEEINADDFQGIPISGTVISAPLSTIRKTTVSGDQMLINIDPDSDKPQFTIVSPSEGSTEPGDNVFSSPQRISGFVYDDDLAGIINDTLTLTFYEWGTSTVVGTPAVYGTDPNLELSGNQWTYTSSLGDGEYGVELSVDDAAGNNGVSNEVPFQVSSFAPVVKIDSPSQGVYIGKGSTTTVQVSVVGSTGDEVYIDLNHDLNYDPAEIMVIDGGGVFHFDIIEGVTPGFTLNNGDYIFMIRAGVDANYGTATLQYTGDITDPSVSITYPAEGQDVNGSINISGTSSDNTLIDKVYLNITTDPDWNNLPVDYTDASWKVPTGSYNWNYPIDTAADLSDSTTYYIFVKTFDSAGNGSDLSDAESSLSFNVDQDSDKPVISLSNMVEGGSANSLSLDASVIGLVEDDDLVDASSLEIRVDIYNDGDVAGNDLNFDGDGVDLTGDLDTDDANELENWVKIIPGATVVDNVKILSWNHSLLNVPQGTHSMQVRVNDTVSSSSILNLTEFIIDFGPPDLEITNPSNGAIFKDDFTINGTATDPGDVSLVEISFNSGSSWTDLEVTPDETVAWSYDFTVASNGDDDGNYSYLVRATDSLGSKTTLERQVVVDTTAATATITSVPETTANDGASFLFEGTATDPLSGVEAVWINFVDSDTDKILAAGKTAWSATVNLATALGSEGPQTIYVKVEDKAGNYSAWTDTQQVFVYDTAIPTVTLNEDANRDVNAGFSLSGTAADNYGIDTIEITQSKDGGSDIPVDVNGPTGTTSWSLAGLPRNSLNIEFQNISDGSYVYSIKSTDLAGKESIEIVSTVTLDQTAPDTLSVTNPGAGQTGLNALSGDAYTFSGTSGDSGVGMSKIYYLIDQLPAASTSTTIGDYTELATTGNWSFTKDFDTDNGGPDTGMAEGSWYIHVLAEDTSGNRTAFGIPGNTVEFDIDQASPVITEVDSSIPGSSTVYFNSDINLGGTASDGNSLTSVEVTYSIDGAASETLGLTDTLVDGTPAIWGTTLMTSLGDGVYEVSITATDIVGKTTVITRHIVIDTVAPVVNFNGVSPVVGSNTVNSTISWSGTTSDETAINTVQYQLPGGALTDVNNKTNWIVSGIDTTGGGFSEDADNDLRIVATDKAGNSTDSSYTIYVDQDSDLPSFSYTNVDSANDTVGEAGNNLLETGAKIVGTITDDDGVNKDTIEVKIYDKDDVELIPWAPISTPPASNGTYVNWSHNLSALSDGVYSAQFRADDTNGGQVTTTEKVYFTIDLNPASLSVDFPVSGAYESVDFDITGTASDANGLLFGDHDSNGGTAETDYIAVSTDGGTVWENIAVAGDGSWSYSVSAPVDHGNDGAKIYLFKAKDIFEKSTTKTLDFTIDTLAPSLTVSAPTADLWTNVFSLAINGTASDANGVQSVEASLDNSNWSTVNGTTTWSNLLDISGEAEQENKIVYFRSTDIAGNVTTDTRNINIDRTAPDFSETSYGSSFPQYETSDYSLGGTLTDNLTDSLPTFDHDSDGGTTPEVPYINVIRTPGGTTQVDATAGVWTHSETYSAGTYNYELTISDRAGNLGTSIYRTVIADNAAPSLDSIDSPTGAELFLSGSAFSISGAASDSGDAGLDSVYWWVGAEGDTPPAAADPFTGWTKASGTSSWSDSLDLTTIGEGDQTLHAFAVDKTGLISPVSTRVFTIDQAAPIVIEDSAGGSNRSSNTDVSLELTITETNGIVSGDLLDGGAIEDVEYFEIMLNGSDWAADSQRIEYTGADMTLTIPAADFSDGTNEILIRATDLAERTSSIIKRDVFFDNLPPTVSFINIDGSSVVNGETFNIQGTTTDTASTISSVTIAVNGPEDADYGSEQAVAGSVYSWNYDLDLTPSGTYYSDNPISVRVTAVDSVGNTTVEELTFSIDQLDDMPSIALSGTPAFTQSLSADVTADNYVLAGVLFDDDGVDLDSLVVTFDGIAQSPKVINGSDEDTEISWFVDLSDKAAGTYNFTVTADDITANTATGNFSGMIDTDIPVLGSTAKITGSAEDDDAFDTASFTLMQNGSDLSGSVSISGNSTYVPWTYTLPALDNLYYLDMNGADATTAAIPVDWAKYSGESVKTMVVKDSGAPEITITSPSQGAYVNGSVISSGEAFDDLAINSLTITAIQSDNSTSLELTSDAGVALDKTETTGEYYYDTATGKYVWNFLLERLPDAYENDSINLVYEAEDIAGNTTTKERSVTIDTEDPIIDIQYPSDGALVTGDVTIQGVTYDERIDLVEIKRGLSGSWETLPGTYNWNYTFNSVSVVGDATANGDGTYNYPIEVRATDAAGNMTTVSTYSFNISPDLDKPVLSVSTPEDNATLGGEILLIGTATDNEAVSAVYVRIDINGDNDYDDSFDLDNANGTNDDFEREGTWYPISDFQNSVWKVQINSDGTLYRSNTQITGTPEDFIHVQLMAEDIDGAQSIVLTRTITLDETFPEITNFGLSGGGSDISGNINLVGDITDNEGITNIDISYNGGLTYEPVYVGSTLSYTLDLNKDSEADVGSGGLGYADNSAIVKVRLKVTDTTGYQAFSNLELSVDNISPTGSYTGKVNDIGTAGGTGVENIVTVSGTAKDSGVVSSFDRVEVYIVQEGDITTPKTGVVSTKTTFDFEDGNGPVIYPDEASDFIVIDNTIEQGATDTDSDGYIENITYSSGETHWSTEFDTSFIDNNKAVEVHYVVYDKAGNASHYVEIMLIVGSDLDNDGTVEDSEQIAYPQAFQARRGLLYFELFGGTKTGYNITVDDNLGNSTETTTAPTTMVTLVTSDALDYPEGEAIFTIRVYESAVLKLTKNISVDIKGDDTEPPVLTMSPLSQSSVVDGHLEEGDAGNGADFDISGTVKFEGTVSDDTMVQDVVLNIEGETPIVLAEWDGGLFTAKNGAVISNQSLDWKEGHSVSFSYDWDSSTITNTADLDLDVTFEVRDYANPTVNNTETYDVVPYISEVITSLSDAYSSNSSVINRSSLGFYPVRENEVLTILGFNFNGIVNTTINVGLTALTGLDVITGVDEDKGLTANLGSTAISGDLNVVVNSVTSINNSNSNTSSNNQEGNGVNNNSLTDDRELYIWSFDEVVSSSTLRFPNMSVSKGTGEQVGFIYDSGAQLVRMNIDGSDFQIDKSFTQWYDTAFTLDSTGRAYGGSMNGDYGAGSGDQRMVTSGAGYANFKYYAWNTPTSRGSNSTSVYSAYGSGSKSRAIENAYNSTVFNSNRVLNPKLATYLDGTTQRVFMSYYDSSDGEVKYRAGTVTGSATNPTFGGALVNHDNPAGGSAAGYHSVADSSDPYKPGEYSDVDVLYDSTDGLIAVMAWYDADSRSLIYSWNDSPTATTAAAAAKWQTNATVIDSDFAGWYVDVEVDSDNGIHIAYYNSSSGDLKYAYQPEYKDDVADTDDDIKIVTVDSFLSTGENISLTVKKDGTDQIPFISYYMGSYTSTNHSVRVAWKENLSSLEDGVVSDKFTGDWEVMTIPTNSNPKKYNIGNGIKSNGIIVGYATDLGLETGVIK